MVFGNSTMYQLIFGNLIAHVFFCPGRCILHGRLLVVVLATYLTIYNKYDALNANSTIGHHYFNIHHLC